MENTSEKLTLQTEETEEEIYSCCVPTCPNILTKGGSINFYPFPEADNLLRGLWAHCLKVEDEIEELKTALVCNLHFNSDDFVLHEGVLTLLPNAIPKNYKSEVTNNEVIESKSVIEPSSINVKKPKTNIVSEWPTLLPTTSTDSGSSNNSLPFIVTEHRIHKTIMAVENDSTNQRPTSPKNTKKFSSFYSDYNKNNQTPPTRTTLLARKRRTKGALSHTVSSAPDQIFAEFSKKSEPKYKYKISDQMMLRDKQIADLRFYIKHHTVKKDLFINVYRHYLEMMHQVLMAEEHLLNEYVDISKIKLFSNGIKPIEIPMEILNDSCSKVESDDLSG